MAVEIPRGARVAASYYNEHNMMAQTAPYDGALLLSDARGDSGEAKREHA